MDRRKATNRSLKMPKGALALAGILLAGSGARPALAQDVFTWMMPLEKAAGRLEQLYAKPVTYEDPQRLARSEIEFLMPRPGGPAPTPGGPRYFRVLRHTFVMPPGVTPAEAPTLNAELVNKVVEAYHQQNPGQARYRVLESRLGVHIVPLQVHDETGALVAASSPLDTVVGVPKARRTASEHLTALFQAVTAASGIPVNITTTWFDDYFAANGYLLPADRTGAERPYMLFEWGVDMMAARDALIDLMDGSSSTMSWRLECGPIWQDKTCYFAMMPLAVGPTRRVVSYDRCTNCQRIPKK